MSVTWTDSRKELLALLSGRHCEIGEMYRRAIEALTVDSIQRVDLMISAHCLREMFSSIPRVIDDVARPARADPNRPVRDLHRAWGDAGLDFEALSEAELATVYTVPASVFHAAKAVAVASEAGTRNSRQVTAIVATGQAAVIDSPPLNRLHAAINFFREWVHARDYSKPERPIPPTEQIEIELRIIEEALMTRFGNMADQARKVREALAVANRRQMGPS